MSNVLSKNVHIKIIMLKKAKAEKIENV